MLLVNFLFSFFVSNHRVGITLKCSEIHRDKGDTIVFSLWFGLVSLNDRFNVLSIFRLFKHSVCGVAPLVRGAISLSPQVILARVPQPHLNYHFYNNHLMVTILLLELLIQLYFN